MSTHGKLSQVLSTTISYIRIHSLQKAAVVFTQSAFPTQANIDRQLYLRSFIYNHCYSLSVYADTAVVALSTSYCVYIVLSVTSPVAVVIHSCNFFVQRHVNNIRLIIIIITPPPANFYPGYIPQKTIPWVIPRFLSYSTWTSVNGLTCRRLREKRSIYKKNISPLSPEAPLSL